MKNRSSWILAVIAVLVPCSNSLAGGEQGNGGDARVCFDHRANMSRAVRNGAITAEGNAYVVSAHTLEYESASQMKNRSRFLEDLSRLPFQNTVDAIHDRFKVVPEFYRKILRAQKILGSIETTIRVPYGLKDIPDSGSLTEDDPYCPELQAAVRYRDQLQVAERIYDRLDTLNRALLQVHEEIYMIGAESEQFGIDKHHETSANARNLIIFVLTQDFSPSQLQRKLTAFDYNEGINPNGYVLLEALENGKQAGIEYFTKTTPTMLAVYSFCANDPRVSENQARAAANQLAQQVSEMGPGSNLWMFIDELGVHPMFRWIGYASQRSHSRELFVDAERYSSDHGITSWGAKLLVNVSIPQDRGGKLWHLTVDICTGVGIAVPTYCYYRRHFLDLDIFDSAPFNEAPEVTRDNRRSLLKMCLK